MWQRRHLTLNFVRSGFPSLPIDKEVPRFPITKGRRKITDDPRVPILGLKLKNTRSGLKASSNKGTETHQD